MGILLRDLSEIGVKLMQDRYFVPYTKYVSKTLVSRVRVFMMSIQSTLCPCVPKYVPTYTRYGNSWFRNLYQYHVAYFIIL